MADGNSLSEARAPRQGRSRASYERMVTVTLDLLRERGDAGFTLAEVSRLGGVSIGSIYCRFENKDALVREVHGRLMATYGEEQRALLREIGASSTNLATLVPRFVTDYAEFLRARASALMPLMTLAAQDETIAQAGKQSYQELSAGFRDLVFTYRAEVSHADPARAASSTFGIIYAALARHLGLGGAVTAIGEGDWEVLKQDLGAMALAFLQGRT